MSSPSEPRPIPQGDSLAAAGLVSFEAGFSALDAYHGVAPGLLRFLLVEGGLADIAKASEGLEYPGLPYADAALSPAPRAAGAKTAAGATAGDNGLVEGSGDSTKSCERTYIRLADSAAQAERAAFSVLDLLRDPTKRGVYLDPRGIRTSLRSKRLEPRPAPAEEELFQAAGLLARYDYELPPGYLPAPPRDFPLESQRDLLVLILTGRAPERALDFLRACGFIDAYWPELEALAGVDQAKEFHPEGDVWAHTMETFRHRKLPDLRLSLGLLLHDAGKPRASASGGRKFDRHAELGTSTARRFLSRLGFPSALCDDVAYLVRYHMLPAALPRLPLERGIEGVDEPLFPLLLELYRCDELSSFKGPEGYYEACAAYRNHQKNVRNPWRNPEAARLARVFLPGR
jgi:poly(A) polymerase